MHDDDRTPRTAHPFSGDAVGIFRDGLWVIDSNRSAGYDPGDFVIQFGAAGDSPVTGKWTAGSPVSVGVFRDGQWRLDLDRLNIGGPTASQVDTGSTALPAPDLLRTFGTYGDVPVTGDWNGDGVTDIGIFRNGLFVLDTNASGAYEFSDAAFVFGTFGDTPVAGDWDGDGDAEVGVYREGLWVFDTDASRGYAAGDRYFTLGSADAYPIVGAWQRGTSNVDMAGLRINVTIGRDTDNDGEISLTADEPLFTFGFASDIPVVIRF